MKNITVGELAQLAYETERARLAYCTNEDDHLAAWQDVPKERRSELVVLVSKILEQERAEKGSGIVLAPSAVFYYVIRGVLSSERA